MTQQYSTKVQRITILIALLLLILVIAKSVAAGSMYTTPQKTCISKNSEDIQDEIADKAVCKIEDIPWRPILSLIQ